MKKEFIDFMYEQRSLIQEDIDRLAILCEDPPYEPSDYNETMAELRTRRSQIQSLNATIQKYFDIHAK